MRVNPQRLFVALIVFALGAATLRSGAEEAALLVPVEAGMHRIQVEVWDPAAAQWQVYSVAHLEGEAGTVKLRIPAEVPQSQLRVRATPEALVPAAWIDADTTVTSTHLLDQAQIDARSGGPAFEYAGTDQTVSDDDEVVESDIWRLDGETLYFFNRLRGLQVFDLSDPSDPLLLGSLRYPGRGEQMYQLDAERLLLLGADGEGMRVELVRLADGAPYIADSFGDLPGYYVESRLVGDRLYLVTRDYRMVTFEDQSEDWRPFFIVHGFDFSDPAAPVALGSLEIELEYGWGNAVTATNDTLLVTANHRVYDSEDGDWWSSGWNYRSTVYLIDLKSSDGVPRLRTSAQLSGRLYDKFKLRLRGDVLTAITQAQGSTIEHYTETVDRTPPSNPPSGPPPDGPPGTEPPGDKPDPDDPDGDVSGEDPEPVPVVVERTRRVWHQATVLENLVLGDDDSLTHVGALELAEGETLRATRFDGDRAYIVTFEQVDPLFIVDLSDPANPTALGELEVPGWSNYLQVLDNGRLFSLGVDDGRVALSLFDVADPTAMSLLSRVHLGVEGRSSWSEGNYDEKAISLFEDEGLVLVPFQYSETVDDQWLYHRALQIVEMDDDALTLRGVIHQGDHIRRATRLGADNIVSVSNEELVTASLADLDAPALLGERTIAWRADEVFLVGEYLLQLEKDSDPGIIPLDSADSPRVVPGPGPVVRVTTRESTDELLHTFELPTGWLAGLTVRDGVLHALYYDRFRIPPEDLSSLESTFEIRYHLALFDVSDPLQPAALGETTVAPPVPSDSLDYWYTPQLQPAWRDAETLVWMPSAESPYPYYFLDYGFTGIFPEGSMRLASDYFWWPYAHRGLAHVLVTRVGDPLAPQFTGTTDLDDSLEHPAGQLSESFLVGNRVALSARSQWYERVPDPTPEYPDRYTYNYYEENHLLTVAIAGDGSLGTPLALEIPGTLTGAIPLEDGAFIALTREYPEVANDSSAERLLRFQAHLFDGAQLLPLDRHTLPFEASGYRDSFVYHDRVVYYPASTDDLDEGAVQRLTFASTGQFEPLADLPLGSSTYPQLELVDEHLLARANDLLRLWRLDGTDATHLADFEPQTQHYYGSWWGWGGDARPALDPAAGLWIAASSYGVDYYPLAPEGTRRLSLMAWSALRAEAATAAPGWTEIPATRLTRSELDSTDAVGPITELRWRFKASDFAALDPTADDYTDYWYQSSWYGWYHQRGDDHWVYHLFHGWLWTLPQDGGAWIHDRQLGWCWIESQSYPYLYAHDRGNWLFFGVDFSKKGTRWFYDLGLPEDEAWFSVPRN